MPNLAEPQPFDAAPDQGKKNEVASAPALTHWPKAHYFYRVIFFYIDKY
jgi:hypothetical protein